MAFLSRHFLPGLNKAPRTVFFATVDLVLYIVKWKERTSLSEHIREKRKEIRGHEHGEEEKRRRGEKGKNE